MLLVQTRLDRSEIDGIGLFADEFIPAGAVVWEMNETIDLALTRIDIERLSETSQRQVLKYSYLDRATGMYIFCGDDARFFNHASQPNCLDLDEGVHGGRTIAKRDIHPGEELTCDYSLFDAEFSNYAVTHGQSYPFLPAYAE